MGRHSCLGLRCNALAAALMAYATEPARAADPDPLVLVKTITLKGG